MSEAESVFADAVQRGRIALQRGAWEEARTAWEAIVAARADDAAAWEALGTACMWLQDAERLLDVRQQAYTLYRERGDDAAAARMCLDLAGDFMDLRGEFAIANGWLQRARRLLETLPPAREHALLNIWDAYTALVGACDPAAAQSHAREAVAIAAAVNAADIGILALALQGLAMVTEGSVRQGMALLDEALAAALAGEISDPQSVCLACCCMIDACDRVRDYGRALEWCDRLRDVAVKWRVQSFLTTCRIKYSGVLLWRGDWEAAENEIERAIAELNAARPPAVSGGLVRLAELRRRQGRTSEAEQLLLRCSTHGSALSVRAALALDAGDAASAIDFLNVVLRRTQPGARMERVAALELKTRAHMQLDQLADARQAAEELQAIADHVDTPPLRATALVARALVSAAQPAAARPCLEDAVHLLEISGSPYEAARARIELARVLARLDRAAAARTEVTAALAVLEPMGALPEVAGARALLQDLGARAPSDGQTAGPQRKRGQPGLTSRQCQILALVAQGLSDREIATRLFLSEFTVHRHVSNIMTRLGASSRAAAVASALRAGLLQLS